jgi:transposase InsO family protein
MKQRKLNADVVGPRYRAATKKQKSLILTEFCQNNDYHRKYAISLLRSAGKTRLMRVGKKTVKLKITAHRRAKRLYKPYYDQAVRRAVVALWEFFHRVCGTRLVPMIRANLDALSAEGKFRITSGVKEKLKTISRSTIERMLRAERAGQKVRGTVSTKPGTLLKHQIPVRVFWRWEDKQPGFREIDTVSHDGGFIGRENAYTLSLTDVCVCWSEFRALRNKARRWTEEALEDIRHCFPVLLKGLDSDNGAEFVNWHLKTWCERHRITFTRGRQYHKNDNAYVEQKNGDIVRKTIGYERFAGEEALQALARVYKNLNPLLNFFYPNMKCVDKLRVGQRVKRVYEKSPKTPYERVLEHADIPREVKTRLRREKAGLNIVELQEALDAALDNLRLFVHHAPGGPSRHETHGKNLT